MTQSSSHEMRDPLRTARVLRGLGFLRGTLPPFRRRLARALLVIPRDEQGSSAIEMLIMASVAMALVLVVVASGRYVDGAAQANDAAYAAARAASLEPAQGSAYAAGRRAAAQSLADRGKSCQSLRVSYAGTHFAPGGDVIVEVTCTVNLLDTGALGRELGLAAHRNFTQRAVVPIETYRTPPAHGARAAEASGGAGPLSASGRPWALESQRSTVTLTPLSFRQGGPT